MLPCRPSGVTLDIKKSSYKKLSKWLQSRSASGLVRFLLSIFFHRLDLQFLFCLLIKDLFLWLTLE